MASFSSSLATRCLMDERKVGDCITASLKLNIGKRFVIRHFAGPFTQQRKIDPRPRVLMAC